MKSNYLVAGASDVYILISWPFIQELMEYDWFRTECILYQAIDEQKHLDSAYFVPLKRLAQSMQPE